MRTPFCGKPGCEWPHDEKAEQAKQEIWDQRERHQAGLQAMVDVPSAVLHFDNYTAVKVKHWWYLHDNAGWRRAMPLEEAAFNKMLKLSS